MHKISLNNLKVGDQTDPVTIYLICNSLTKTAMFLKINLPPDVAEMKNPFSKTFSELIYQIANTNMMRFSERPKSLCQLFS